MTRSECTFKDHEAHDEGALDGTDGITGHLVVAIGRLCQRYRVGTELRCVSLRYDKCSVFISA